MPHVFRDPAWGKSTGDLVFAWNLETDADASPDDPTRTPRLAEEYLLPLEQTVEPREEGQSVTEEEAAEDSALDFSLDSYPPGWPGPGQRKARETRNAPRRSHDGEAPIPFPRIGEYFAGFLIRGELGRGTFGRVYLAEQSGLANRPVALKVSRLLGEEPRNLARLQHAHIVPIYSVHDDPITGLRLLCMPYVGGTNLARILELLGPDAPLVGTGRTFIQALDRLAALQTSVAAVGSSAFPESPAPDSPWSREPEHRSDQSSPVREDHRRHLPSCLIGPDDGLDEATAGDAERGAEQPARHFLRRAGYIQAAVWVAARLAEALEHAHDRGLLHRDVKPSNVLIAGDGTPMLLDFNLSTDIFRESTPAEARAMLGGTLPYMSPEHLDAFNPIGTTSAKEIDGRSDIYAIGLILFEMITGAPPFEEPPASLPLVEIVTMMTYQRRMILPSARAINPKVSWSLESVLWKCLEPNPDRRYRLAGELAEDLRRLLDDRPLRHAPELSVRERAAKWVRRHPGARSTTTLGMVSAGLILGLGIMIWGLNDHLAGLAAKSERAAFATTFRECQLRLNTLSGSSNHLDQGLREARGALRRYQVLTHPDWTSAPLVARLEPAERAALRAEMAELLFLTVRGEVMRAKASGRPSLIRPAYIDAIRLLDCAERFDPSPSPALYEDRAAAWKALGRPDRARLDRARAETIPLRSSRDFYLSGAGKLVRGNPEGSERDLERAVAIDPGRFWAWFTLGLCHQEQGRYVEAAGDFGVCAALFPDFAWPHLNRGLALAAAGRNQEARFEYDRALELSPNFREALVNRGLASLALGENRAAFRDLDRTIKLGHHDPGVLAARAEVLAKLGRRDEARVQFDRALAASPGNPSLRVARGFFRLVEDPAGARKDFLEALAQDPKSARAEFGLANLWRHTEPRAAMRALDRAIKADPNLLDAIQLRALMRARQGDPAAESDVDRLIARPTARGLYNGACALAVLSKSIPDPRYKVRARNLLDRALALGWSAATASSDPDLDPLRDANWSTHGQ
jgi:serine/threonine protein kinase/Tfp pilus assembly protein PilF